MKAKVVARCRSCGAQPPRWVGRCPDCGEWGTVVEEAAQRPAGGARLRLVTTPLSSASEGGDRRLSTGVGEVDGVLGGGLVRGSVILLAGEPGVGKSTLTLQIACAVGRNEDVLLVCGEEAPEQIAARAARIGEVPAKLATIADVSMPAVLSAVEQGPGVVVVDSVQTIFDPDIASAPGSVAQVRECGARLARAAREHGTTVVLIGHVTKDGSIAGPRVLEHLVDVVLTFEGDRQGGLRVLRAQKNRFGSTQEAGFFEMTAGGLIAIRDASRYLLQDRCPGLAGSVLAAAVEGRRPIVLEVQALVDTSKLAVPRRQALGIDSARLPLLTAVLERRIGLKLAGKDVYVSAVGGIRAAEPAADLPVALSILSAFTDLAVPEDFVAFGEVGLAGEIRQVAAADRRLAEARAVGCSSAIVPHSLTAPKSGVRLYHVRHLADVLALLRSVGTSTSGG